MATKPRQMVLNRTHTLTSLMGHSIRFEKGVPVNVPPVVAHEALAIGAEYADGAEHVVEETVRKPEPIDPIERGDKIYEAVLVLVERNDVDDFTAAGLPKADAVGKQAGFKATNKDVARAWQRRADALDAARDA